MKTEPLTANSNDVPRRRMFGFLEFGLLLVAIVLLYQFLPSHIIKTASRWSAVQWTWLVQAMDVREWSLISRLMVNGLFVLALIGYLTVSRLIVRWRERSKTKLEQQERSETGSLPIAN